MRLAASAAWNTQHFVQCRLCSYRDCILQQAKSESPPQLHVFVSKPGFAVHLSRIELVLCRRPRRTSTSPPAALKPRRRLLRPRRNVLLRMTVWGRSRPRSPVSSSRRPLIQSSSWRSPRARMEVAMSRMPTPWGNRQGGPGYLSRPLWSGSGPRS